MKKKFTGLFLLLLSLAVYAQKDIPKLQSNYDSLIKNTIYGNNKKAGKYYDIRGIKMYCEVYGAGEPLLLIHGNGASISSFIKQIPYFAKSYKVIIADSRAQGKSTDKNDSLTYEMMADDYAALLTAMGIDSVNVIGWSDGGINGLLLAIRYPKKVKKLIITGANLQPDTSAIANDMHELVMKTYLMLKQKENKTETDKMVFKLFKLLIEQPNIPLTDLHKISAPTLVIGGDNDIIRVRHTVSIFENIPRANLWILPHSGHSTLVVYADEFNKKAATFLNSKYSEIEGRARGF